MEALWIALQITLVGMGLVFGAILLLWIVMVMLVKFTSEKPPIQAQTTPVSVGFADDRNLKLRAASAAVVFALATRKRSKPEDEKHQFPLPSTAIVSPWQSVMRANMLNKRGRVR